MSEHFGFTGETAHQVARVESLREITDADRVRGRRIDVVAYLQDFWKRSHYGVSPDGGAVGGEGTRTSSHGIQGIPQHCSLILGAST
jgi:hypothetical protein